MSPAKGVTALRALAKRYGVQREWRTGPAVRHTVGDDTLLAVLQALGAPVGSVDDAPDALRAFDDARARQVIEPTLVQWGDDALTVDVRVPAPGALQMTLDAEDGTKGQWSVGDGTLAPVAVADGRHRITLPAPVPRGVHHLHVEAGGVDADATVIAAPVRLAAPRPVWGVFAPMYALHTAETATGDLATFDRFTRWAGSHGAQLVGTLPLLASFLGAGAEPTEPSPYAPVSRRHWNEVYVDLTSVPEVDGDGSIADPSPGANVDLPALARVKRAVLETAAARVDRMPARRDELARWLDERPDVVAYARFRAAVEGDDAAARYHEYAQWIVESQLVALAGRMRERDQDLYLDLPIGAHPDGFDVASEADLFATGASVGAPPDAFFSGGQDWGFPPVLPAAARASGHRYLRECVDTHLRVARRLRVDHVMGMHRMWWVPRGASPVDGAYVTYPAGEQYAVLTLAAARAGAQIVGENLGTVPPETNRALHEHRMLGMYVVPFELDADADEPLRAPAARELACLDTHDTPTYAAWWRDLAPPERSAVLDWLRAGGMLRSTDGEAVDPEDVLGALLEWLGESDAAIVLASLEDLWLEVEAQNVPGTTSAERPNFRRRVAHSLEELEASSTLADTLARLDRARQTKTKKGSR